MLEKITKQLKPETIIGRISSAVESAVRSVELHYWKSDSKTKLDTAVKIVNVILKPFRIDLPEDEVKELVEATVEYYNLTKTFLNKIEYSKRENPSNIQVPKLIQK